MPTPIAHSAMTMIAAPWLRRLGAATWPRRQRWLLTAAIVIALCAPDFDFLFRLVPGTVSPALDHGGAAHSVVAGLAFGLLFGIVLRVIGRVPLSFFMLSLIGVLCYESHILMDACTRGRGVMLLWPFSTDRVGFPIPLFYGMNHSQPSAWDLHLITLGTELAFAGLIWLATRRWRTPSAERHSIAPGAAT